MFVSCRSGLLEFDILGATCVIKTERKTWWSCNPLVVLITLIEVSRVSSLCSIASPVMGVSTIVPPIPLCRVFGYVIYFTHQFSSREIQQRSSKWQQRMWVHECAFVHTCQLTPCCQDQGCDGWICDTSGGVVTSPLSVGEKSNPLSSPFGICPWRSFADAMSTTCSRVKIVCYEQ